ncbi:hypothetical protein NDU88_006369 [Pleurodeles waltl]|uniref:Uncharacterized protein n=1 Tax=Pleurodeles waltl TaxID=8319 RepID=A0AAV7MHA1_PLEWA|nr:hypothetical protein NDU88_006369 [Pleurodeles waltl]
MEDHGSPTFFSPEENQEEADIWRTQGVQQPLETPTPTNTEEVQPSDSGFCLLSDESVAAPAKRKRPARAAAGSKLKRAKKDTADSNLPEGPSTSQTDSGPRRARKDNEEQEAAGQVGFPSLLGGWPQGQARQLLRSRSANPQAVWPAAPP